LPDRNVTACSHPSQSLFYGSLIGFGAARHWCQ
jgi:hypothetical protein